MTKTKPKRARKPKPLRTKYGVLIAQCETDGGGRYLDLVYSVIRSYETGWYRRALDWVEAGKVRS